MSENALHLQSSPSRLHVPEKYDRPLSNPKGASPPCPTQQGFQLDLHWLVLFLEGWNGRSMFDSIMHNKPQAMITSVLQVPAGMAEMTY